MGKGFRLEISKLISSFKSCRSKDPSSLPSNPVPLSHAHKPSIRATPNDLRKERREFRWRKEEEWHVVAVTTSHHNNKPTPRRKISNSSLYEETLAAPPPPEKRNRQARKSKKVIAGVGKRDAGEAVGVQEADTVQPGGEGEGELCDGEEIEGPLRGFQRINGGDDFGETDVRETGFGAAATVFLVSEYEAVPWDHRRGFLRDLGGIVLY
nr:transcription repressor OFP7 [Ipomoea batatas]